MKRLLRMYLKPCILICLSAGGLSAVHEASFTAYNALAGIVCSSDRRLFAHRARSRISCVFMAKKKAGCTGVSYHDEEEMCYGCDTFEGGAGKFKPLPGAVFYLLTPLPDGFTDVAGFFLKIVENESVPYDSAAGACAKSGRLFRIDTPEKQRAISSFLLDPANGYAEIRQSYWIQCHQDSAGFWKFDDGTPMPMNNTYWLPGEPRTTSGACCYLWNKWGFKWDDYWCDLPNGYVCELSAFP